MPDEKPRWEVERDRLNALHPAQTWVYRQWWLYGVVGLGLLIASVADDDPGLRVPAGIGLLAAAFGYRHR